MRLHVIVRTASSSLLTPKDRQRVSGNNRELLLRKCFESLIRCIESSQHRISLTVLDDHSDARWLDFVESTAQRVDFELHRLSDKGPNNSAHKQLEVARDSDSLVYIVEDDYLHEPNAIDHMLGAYTHFIKRHNMPTVIYPYDCSLRYQTNTEAETTLYYDGIRYWREVDKTALTLLTHYSVIQDHWDAFDGLAVQYPKLMEDDTINKLYWSSTNRSAPIRAYSPIPSVAYHMGYSTPTSINTSHVCWQNLWAQTPNWQLIQGWFYHPDFYQWAVQRLPENSTIVEVGSWRGRSTACLASLLKESGKKATIYAVDTWEGSDGEALHHNIKTQLHCSLYEDFVNNLKMCEVDELVTPLRMTSQLASLKFEDTSLDFVMIDGAHDYDSVSSDIQMWLPKVKPGGIIAGDDYSPTWPGVKKAVDEIFGDEVTTREGLWFMQK